MTRLDFIVHPEHAILADDADSLKNYADRISSIPQENPNTIVVTGDVFPTAQNDFERKIFMRLYSHRLVPEGKILEANGITDKNHDYNPFGHVSRMDWPRLAKILDSDYDEIRINGCFYGNACLQNLAVQIFGYLEFGAHWYDWKRRTGVLKQYIDLSKEILRCDWLEISGKFEDVPVKYGVVFSNKSIGQKKALNIIPSFLIPKPLDEQLTDEKTEIFG